MLGAIKLGYSVNSVKHARLEKPRSGMWEIRRGRGGKKSDCKAQNRRPTAMTTRRGGEYWRIPLDPKAHHRHPLTQKEEVVRQKVMEKTEIGREGEQEDTRVRRCRPIVLGEAVARK